MVFFYNRCDCYSDRESQDANAYWRKLKQRLLAEGNQTVTNCHTLKMTALDGKMRLTDVADTEQLLRIIQSVPSKKAEPFKAWENIYHPDGIYGECMSIQYSF